MRTGSLFNNLYGESRQPEPIIGMGATILGWSDRHAATVVEVGKTKREVVIQRDHAKRTDTNGLSETQTYEYIANTDARKDTYTLRKDGGWVRKGESLKSGQRIMLGRREEYADPTF